MNVLTKRQGWRQVQGPVVVKGIGCGTRDFLPFSPSTCCQETGCTPPFAPHPKCRPVGNAHGPTWEQPIDRLYQGGFAQTSVSPALKHAMYDPQGPGSQALTPTVLGYTCLTGAGLTFSRQRAHVSLDRGWHRVGVLTVAHFEEELGDGCLYAEGVAHVTPLGITTQSQHQAVQVSVFFRLAKPFACPLPEQGSSQRPFIDTTGQILFITTGTIGPARGKQLQVTRSISKSCNTTSIKTPRSLIETPALPPPLTSSP